jgi:hypothetical protein
MLYLHFFRDGSRNLRVSGTVLGKTILIRESFLKNRPRKAMRTVPGKP